MSEIKEIKINLLSEIKAIVLIILPLLGFLFVKEKFIFIYAIGISLVLFLIKIYISANSLKIADILLKLISAFYNVISLFFMVQYFKASKVDTKIFEITLAPFIVDGKYKLAYVIWIFVLSLGLLVLRTNLDENSGETYGRQ